MMHRLAFLLCVAFTLANVVVINKDNFDEVLNSKDNVVINFYASWCSRSNTFRPTYEIIGKTFENSSEVTVAQIDCNEGDLNPKCAEFGIGVYPALLLFKNKRTEDVKIYHIKNADSREFTLVDWINSNLGIEYPLVYTGESSITKLDDSNFVELVLQSKKNALVFFTSGCFKCQRIRAEYEKLAVAFKKEKTVLTGVINCLENPNSCSKFNIESYPSVLYFAKGDKKNPIIYQEPIEFEWFLSYVNGKAKTYREPNGNLSEKAGKMNDFDDLIARIRKNEDEALIVLEEAKLLAKKIGGKDAETYVKCFEYFAQDKNSVYHHFKLLEKMIEDAQIAESGLDAATKRKNIFEDFDIKWYGRERGHLYNKNHIIA